MLRKKVALFFLILSLGSAHAFDAPTEGQMQMAVLSSLESGCEKAAGPFWSWTQFTEWSFSKYQTMILVPALQKRSGGLDGLLKPLHENGATFLTDLLIRERKNLSLLPTIEALDRLGLSFNYFAPNNAGLNSVFLAALVARDAPVLEFLLRQKPERFQLFEASKNSSSLLPEAQEILQKRLAGLILSPDALEGLKEKGLLEVDVKMLGRVLDLYEVAEAPAKAKIYEYLQDLLIELPLVGDTQEALAFLLRFIPHIKKSYTLELVLGPLNNQHGRAAFVSLLTDEQHFALTEAVIQRLDIDGNGNASPETSVLVKGMLLMLIRARVNIGAEKNGKNVLLTIYAEKSDRLNALTRVALQFTDFFKPATLESLR